MEAVNTTMPGLNHGTCSLPANTMDMGIPHLAINKSCDEVVEAR